MDWFSFYTTERAQWFFVNGMMSNSLPVSCSVQQSSVLGPVLSYHTLRTSHQKCQLSYHLYTDDKEAYVTVPVSDVSVAHDLLQHCIIDTSSRCAWHWLQLNVAITELVWYGSRQILKKLSNCELTVRSDITVISPVKSVCNLGTHLDNQLKMKNLYFKWSLCASMSSTKFARCAGLLDKTLHYSLCWFHTVVTGLLLHVTNATARVVMDLSPCDHMAPALKHLHWLPVEHRILYKICLHVFPTCPLNDTSHTHICFDTSCLCVLHECV